MTDERRYTDDEVREILGRATSPDEADRPAVGRSDETGLTLAELQSIGREVGIEPTQIAHAAAALDRAGRRVPRRKLLGMPVGVGLVVDLPRAPTDREWEILVSELRQTFEAKGRVESHGDLRSWTNSRLHAHVEPTPTGYRLRLGTLKSNAFIMDAAGFAGLVIGGFTLVTSGLADLAEPMIMATMGAAAIVANRIRIPPWARTRERQMEYIAERASQLVASDPDDVGGAEGPETS
jgi:hypothetical protein